jgi:hypothetical protein
MEHPRWCNFDINSNNKVSYLKWLKIACFYVVIIRCVQTSILP